MLTMEIKKLTRSSLNSEECNELAELIEELTHSGSKTLESNKLKKVKTICKSSNNNVERAYDLIFHQLEKNHSEIRFSAFQLCDEIFRKSHCFRQLVIDNLRHILELTAETSPDLPLPLPRNVALNLKKLALTTVSEWNNKFGSQYKKLSLGFNYLKQCRKVDFSALQLQTDAERAREEEKERRLRAINKERVKKVESELNDFHLDISGTVKSLSSCLDLLLPKPEDFFISLDNDESFKESHLESGLKSSEPVENDFESRKKDIKRNVNTDCDGDNDNTNSEMVDDEDPYNLTSLREFGAHSSKHSVEITLKFDEVTCLKETPENAAVVENVRDMVKLITNSYLPRVKGWLQILSKASESTDTLKKILDLKIRMEKELEKFGRLNIQNLKEDDCVSTDSEMEEVKDDDYGCCSNLNKSKNVKKINGENDWSILPKEENQKDPTTGHTPKIFPSKRQVEIEAQSEAKNSTVLNEPKPSTSKEFEESKPSTSKQVCKEVNERKKKLLTVAPKLPFDIDLYHWEDENIKAPTLLPTSMDTNKFWSSVSGDDVMEVAVPEGSSALRTRVIEFAGEFKPVLRSCRAPLPNGKLCPRKDRYKCPFHGEIIPRDESGKCINPEEELKLKAAEEEKKIPDWQDPQLLKDIQDNNEESCQYAR
ncbi:UV-stimulated scaffold protein A-like isoform X2 [Lycorma delicatula]|uniref:UV-stimulated scaffold protein A-like isoform X2 n=1 Tax=Lycorma delicatula TaxID=130591 RepID=UPI003F51176D